MTHPARRALLHRPFRPQTRNLIAAMTTKPTDARALVIDTLIGALIDGGVWARLDFLYVFAAADSQAALLDWVTPSRSASLVNTPTFTADRHIACDAVNQSINTNFTPSTHAVQMTGTDIFLAAYERSESNGTGRVMGASGGGPLVEVYSRDLSNNAAARLNCANLTTLKASVTSSLGLTTWQRPGTGNGRLSKNGTVEAEVALSGTLTSALPTSAIHVNARNVNGTPGNFRGGQYAMVCGGRSMTSQQLTDLYTAVQAYMTAVGANV